MNVIPVINCPDRASAVSTLERLKGFLKPGELVHLDVTDGLFSAHHTWNDPLGWASLASPFPLEVHLMMQNPEEHVDAWLAAGTRRLIVHVETVTVPTVNQIFELARPRGADVMLSSNPETTSEDLEPFLRYFNFFQVLAVMPGAAGQKFLPFVADKVRFLREHVPSATIEVDGGMTPETVAIVKAAGADTVVSASYVLGSADPKKAYDALRAL